MAHESRRPTIATSRPKVKQSSRDFAAQCRVMRSLIQAVYRFRDATLVDEKKGDFGSALQNLDRELVRAGTYLDLLSRPRPLPIAPV